MRVFNSLLVVCLIGYFVGCQESASIPEVASKAAVAVHAEQPVASQQQQEEENPSRADRLLNKATDLFKKAADSTSDGAGVSKEWIVDKIREASDGGGAIGDDVAEWANKMFEDVKSSGMTGAGNAQEWVTEDIRNMNAFKYKIEKVSFDDLEALENQLNHLGQLKWECFHVAERGSETVMFFKKERRSLLKNIPLSDMMKIVPFMGKGE